MAKVIRSDLSHSGIQNIIDELNTYQTKLDIACKSALQRLVDKGYTVINNNVGEYNGYIEVKKNIITGSNGDYSAIVGMFDIEEIISEWWKNGKLVTNKEVHGKGLSPTFLSEFGAGLPSSKHPRTAQFGVGPGSYGEHGKESIWYWTDRQGTRHSSTGTEPNMPMEKAFNAMMQDVRLAFKEAMR